MSPGAPLGSLAGVVKQVDVRGTAEEQLFLPSSSPLGHSLIPLPLSLGSGAGSHLGLHGNHRGSWKSEGRRGLNSSCKSWGGEGGRVHSTMSKCLKPHVCFTGSQSTEELAPRFPQGLLAQGQEDSLGGVSRPWVEGQGSGLRGRDGNRSWGTEGQVVVGVLKVVVRL